MIRFATPLTLLTLAAVLSAAPVPKEQPAAKMPNYFPCDLGTKWEYECGKNTSVVEVTKVRHEKDRKIVTFTETWPSTGKSRDSLYQVTKDGVWAVGTGREAEGLEHPILRFPIKPGDSWEEDVKGLGKTVTVVRQPTTIEVPAGKFVAVGTSWTVRGTPAELFQITDFYADGVGLVMTPHARGKGPSNVLKKFTPPPK